jgi:hypothetical protein
MSSALVLGALWIIAVWRGLAIRRDPAKRAPWIALTGLAVALTAGMPAAIRFLNTSTGINDLSTLVMHVSGIIASAAVLDWVADLKDPARKPGLRPHHAAAGIAIAALLILFPIMPRPDTEVFSATVTGGTAAAYLLVFYLYLGTAMTAAAVLFRRVSRLPGGKAMSISFRWGLRLLGAGTTIGACFAAYQVIYLILRLLGTLGPVAAGRALVIGTDIEDLAIALILAGMTVPALGVAMDGIGDLWKCHLLRGLRSALISAVPGVTAKAWGTGLSVPFSYPRLRLIRRVTEIRDAVLALRCRVAPETVTAARTLLEGRGLKGFALDAAAEACWLRLAIRAAQSGAPAQTSPHTLTGGDSLREEVRWLRSVSDATRTDHVTAVTLELSEQDTAAPGR